MAENSDKLTCSDLERILTDSIVEECARWEDIGRELGLKEDRIELIKRNYSHDGSERCKYEMFHHWLRNFDDLTMKDIHQAIERISASIERETNRANAVAEEKKVKDSVKELVKLSKEMDKRNNIIMSDLKNLESELNEEKTVLLTAKMWNEDQNQLARREGIIDALNQGSNCTQSSFVRNLLQRKGIAAKHISGLKDEVINGILLEYLVEIDIDRLQIRGERYQQMKRHHMQVQYLRTEIGEYMNLLEQRLRAYDEIRIGLLNLGVEKRRLEKLKNQLETLKSTLGECNVTKVECDKIHEDGEIHINDMREDLIIFSNSFSRHISDMANVRARFIQAIRDFLAKIALGVGSGAVLGAVFGTAAIPVPVVGTFMGAVTGAVVGGVVGLARGLQRSENEPIRYNIIRNYEETLERARHRQNEIDRILGLAD